MKDYLHRIYLQANGDIIHLKYENGYPGWYLLEGQHKEDESILLDETFEEKCVEELMKHWNKEKAYFSVQHYSEFYMFTKIQNLEKKLERLLSQLSNFKV